MSSQTVRSTQLWELMARWDSLENWKTGETSRKNPLNRQQLRNALLVFAEIW